MLKVIISPAKKMKIRNDILPYKNIPFFIKEAEKLFSYMGNMSFDELKDLWKCSDKLVEENERLRRRLEEKEEEEIRELERRRKMRNFWAYDGTPQEGFSE